MIFVLAGLIVSGLSYAVWEDSGGPRRRRTRRAIRDIRRIAAQSKAEMRNLADQRLWF